jgi:general secretion pathway protein E
LFEVLTVDDAVREHVSSRTHAGKIAAAAKAGGMTTMVDDGIAKCRQGITSIPEVLRVAALG